MGKSSPLPSEPGADPLDRRRARPQATMHDSQGKKALEAGGAVTMLPGDLEASWAGPA